MGWLDHSTNNIILDAVLTDYGRQRLAAANESFNISSYSLGDDEVDYRLIKKYGRSVGKEKIEKNTPVFEAMTNQNQALKYKLVGRESDGAALSFIYLPVFQANPSSAALTNTANQTSAQMSVKLVSNTALNVTTINEESFTLEISDRFFTLTGVGTTGMSSVSTAQALISPGDPNRVASYLATSKTKNECTFQINVRPGIDSTTMSIYGKKIDSSSKRKITSNLRIKSVKYGTTLDIPVEYTQ